jgi:hypothetical protein
MIRLKLIRQASFEYGSKKYGAGTDNRMLFEGCPIYKKSLHLTPLQQCLNYI